MEVPPEITINHIIHNLSYQDILSMSNINQSYHTICNDEYVWYKLYERDYNKIDIPKYEDLNWKHKYQSVTDTIDTHIGILTRSREISTEIKSQLRQVIIKFLVELCMNDVETHGNDIISQTIDDVYTIMSEYIQYKSIEESIYKLLQSIECIIYYTNEVT